jgi:hypothetical protein
MINDFNAIINVLEEINKWSVEINE